jgi:hypothetical protein
VVEPTPSSSKIDQVRKVAKWQRLLIFSFLISIIFTISRSTGLIPRSIQTFAFIGIAFFQLWCVISVCQHLSMELESWIYFIGVNIPYLGLVAVLVLNWRATSFIRASGYQVGFFGANIP